MATSLATESAEHTPASTLTVAPGALHPAPSWRRALRAEVLAADVLAALTSAGVAHLVWFGTQIPLLRMGTTSIDYRLMPVLSAIAWITVLGLGGAYDVKGLDLAADSQRKVRRAGLHLLSLVAVLIYVADVSPPRGYVLLALPLVVAESSFARWALQRRLASRRRRGLDGDPTIVIGPVDASVLLLEHLDRHPDLGFDVLGLVLPTGAPTPADRVPPVLRRSPDAARIAAEHGARVAIVTGPHGTESVQRLAWQLADADCELAVAPAASEIAGPRLIVRHHRDLPLLHLVNPHLSRSAALWKAVTDRVLALVALVLLSPFIALIAAAIRIESKGSPFFRHERLGLNGSTFMMIKFRTMVDGADQQHEAVMSDAEIDGALVKHRADPRVTRVGRVLRRLSIDELPQLLNVLRGEMSLVGPRPRPTVDIELALAASGSLDHREERRMLVKPGMTGLWQVSGRSDLPMDEALRLDMHYIDHWSPQLDLVIMWRTVAAVLAGRGAY